jgi:hypothetical protein
MKRLTEIFQPGNRVEIRFREQADHPDDTWYSAHVVKLDHPGVWVETTDERVWFVTNRRSIKASPADIPRRLLSINRNFYR